jgi:hypothetical protein
MSAEYPTTSVPVEYRDIPGFPGYRVGDDGSIWSRWDWRQHRGRWHELRDGDHKSGYRSVALSLNKTLVRRRVHRLVLEAFVGSCPPGMECCHNDGNPRNNRLDNLRWDTRSSNVRDQIRHGTHFPLSHHYGSRNNSAKLTEDDIPKIRELIAEGLSNSKIGRRFNVHETTISQIRLRKTWIHVS